MSRNYGNATLKNHIASAAPKALADLVKQTQRSGSQTMAAIYDATLAEKKMGNELTEMRDRQGYNVAAETARHLRTSQLIQIQGTTAELMAVAKYQTDLIKEQNKPLDAQDTADRAYDKAVNNLLWQQGSEANISRIPKPDYVGSNARGLGKLWKGFRNAMGI